MCLLCNPLNLNLQNIPKILFLSTITTMRFVVAVVAQIVIVGNKEQTTT
jgi:hypothetical protein